MGAARTKLVRETGTIHDHANPFAERDRVLVLGRTGGRHTDRGDHCCTPSM